MLSDKKQYNRFHIFSMDDEKRMNFALLTKIFLGWYNFRRERRINGWKKDRRGNVKEERNQK